MAWWQAASHYTTHTKWAVLEIAFICLCFSNTHNADAHILIFRKFTSQLIEQFNDMPAQFGPSLPSNGIKVYAVIANPVQACNKIDPPPIPTTQNDYPKNAKFVAIIERGGENCTFETKVRVAQAYGFHAVIVYNNEGDDLEQMSAKNPDDIDIPAVFVGQTTGNKLENFIVSDFVLVINDELPFNINTQLILPFSILIGLCFLIMIFYMIYKCIREERRLRRHRLPKSMLKKLPILKYTKNGDLSYDTCVICLDDFVEGDKLRVLPCRHPYHSHCIDPWLTENRRVCPICKRKVFTKGEARSNRNRQSSLDSVTDTDDDTTPLLQSATVAIHANANGSHAALVITPSTTHHGTFARNNNDDDDDDATSAMDVASDDENVLHGQRQTSTHTARRINPFDRAPNLPPHLAAQFGENQRSIWSLPIFRLFRRVSISVAAPPFLEEVIPDAGERLQNASATLPRNVIAAAPASNASNNILNPNLSGSFQEDDDDDAHQSIYEPIAVVTPYNPTSINIDGSSNANTQQDVFIQTPSQAGGIGVVALPNAAHANALLTRHQRADAATATTERQFLI